MWQVLNIMVALLSAPFRSRVSQELEILALRQQLAVLSRHQSRLKLSREDRLFWVWLSRVWPQWRGCLVIVKPETVLRWHREAYRRVWARVSNGSNPEKIGRPRISDDLRRLIWTMAKDNPLWGVSRIHGEILCLGYLVSERTKETASASSSSMLPGGLCRMSVCTYEMMAKCCCSSNRSGLTAPRTCCLHLGSLSRNLPPSFRRQDLISSGGLGYSRRIHHTGRRLHLNRRQRRVLSSRTLKTGPANGGKTTLGRKC